jgi:hypothetical protein
VDQLAGLPLSSLRPGAVALFHIGRCGSSVLGEMLDRHPAIKWDREIYFHRWTQGNQRFERWDSESFLRRRMWAAGRRWYGFEMKYLAQQNLAIVGLTLDDYLAEIERAGVTHHVVLRRRNALRRMISAVAGVRSGRRHADAGEPDSGPERIDLDVDALRLWKHADPIPLVACLDQIEQATAELRARLADRRVLELTFEDDIAAEGPERAYRRVCAHLGVEPMPVAPHTRRLHAHSVEELLLNYDDVAAALRGTPHEWMLTDTA